jgi:hypothetical protein
MSSLLKNLIMALGIVVVAGLVYYFVIRDDGTEAELTISPESEAVRQTARVLADTKKINNYNLSGEVLRKNPFSSLEVINIDAELTDVGTGRTNPFEVVQ